MEAGHYHVKIAARDRSKRTSKYILCLVLAPAIPREEVATHLQQLQHCWQETHPDVVSVVRVTLLRTVMVLVLRMNINRYCLSQVDALCA